MELVGGDAIVPPGRLVSREGHQRCSLSAIASGSPHTQIELSAH
jgi:hypothetical protein